MRAPRANAFTLIELLVVIAIVGLLIAVLLLALLSAQDTAYRLKCHEPQALEHAGPIPPQMRRNTYDPSSLG